MASSVGPFRPEFVVPPRHDPANALADLLGALSTIDKLAPLEGRQREKRGDAYVVFQYGNSNGELRNSSDGCFRVFTNWLPKSAS